jgi:PDZ domain-containing protein
MATWGQHASAPEMSDIEPTVPGWPTAPGPMGGGPDAPEAPDAQGALGAPPSSPWAALFGGGRGATAVIGLVAALIAVLVVALVASHEASGYFLFSPGTAPVITSDSKCQLSGDGELALPDGTPCVRLVLPRDKVHDIDGELMMVDVEVGQAGPVDWLEYELGLLGRSRQLYPVAVYAGPTPTSELGCQDTQEMVDANEDSALAALAQLHYQVREDSLGAQIDAVFPGTPAWRAGLKCDDLITAVNGKQVRTAAELSALLARMEPGSTVTFTDHPANGGRTKYVKVQLVSPPESAQAGGFTGHSYIGVEIEPRVKTVLPFPVSVDAAGIGGPSAGLAFTLAILDALSNGKLTGGHRVAATGTITAQGVVGDVGGVQEKTVAVEKAGAQVFFVPQVEYTVAKAVANSNLQVIPVTSLAQVLQILRQRYGGGLPEQSGATRA